ncbi:MAG: aminotransferase class V-fold PLP-dependent enzyme [Candidatus Eisenbacteria bacterium]|uniref:Aminotransferase class V-fold PLP-dependent enzyme n=1 Tax=Eiseniibacteriota bacterium TaxID=2212470 RepID=A0A948RU79_UNCEI|nr:aminotransferase class V-fold PLP-dependent enzyme [Candidatus Eisenbacteria bacterium]MBU1950367.1 aminotransferase class V-fold PLP-dependent enzyme [Candidatus Eisenbacteria bacterium]MBU2689552.1 aminotransferase class V-fold PLP-dependent enzyme [Candidatus Eisenbacteria bacterium]
MPAEQTSEHRHHWLLNPDIAFLNHGSFGACPRPVLKVQEDFRRRLERDPVRFMVKESFDLMNAARIELAAFVKADPEDLAFVPNATTGVNAVLRSLTFGPGDELLTTDHEYNACKNALNFVAARTGAKVVAAHIPFPLMSPNQVVEAVLEKATPRTRLVLIDHITSSTALILPVKEIVSALRERGIDTLVDGAHAIGMLDLNIPEIGAAYYTTNCHKWLCTPKGTALLHVRHDLRGSIRPLTISHGANIPPGERSRYHWEFDWTGTSDPTGYLSIPAAIQFMGSLYAGGWAELRERNHALCLAARDRLCQVLGAEPPAPDEMLGSMATMPLSDGSLAPPLSPISPDPLQKRLWDDYGIEVPVVYWPDAPKRWFRISAQAYNMKEDFERLATALEDIFKSGESM